MPLKPLPEIVKALLAPGIGRRTPEETAFFAHALVPVAATKTGQELLRVAADRGVSLRFDSGIIRPPTVAATTGGVIIFGQHPQLSSIGMGQFMLSLVHELAHVRQFANGFENAAFIRDSHPEDALLVLKMLEAEATATALQVGWEMYQAGETRPIGAMLAPGFQHAPAVQAFRDRVMVEGSWAVMDGSAKAAACAAWFGEEAVVSYYEEEGIRNARRVVGSVVQEAHRKRGVLRQMLSENHEFSLPGHFLAGTRLANDLPLCRRFMEVFSERDGSCPLMEHMGGVDHVLGDRFRKLHHPDGTRLMAGLMGDWGNARITLAALENRLRQELRGEGILVPPSGPVLKIRPRRFPMPQGRLR